MSLLQNSERAIDQLVQPLNDIFEDIKFHGFSHVAFCIFTVIVMKLDNVTDHKKNFFFQFSCEKNIVVLINFLLSISLLCN